MLDPEQYPDLKPTGKKDPDPKKSFRIHNTGFWIWPDLDPQHWAILKKSGWNRNVDSGGTKMSVVLCADSSILQTYQLGECHRQEVGASFQVSIGS